MYFPPEMDENPLLTLDDAMYLARGAFVKGLVTGMAGMLIIIGCTIAVCCFARV